MTLLRHFPNDIHPLYLLFALAAFLLWSIFFEKEPDAAKPVKQKEKEEQTKKGSYTFPDHHFGK